MVYDLSIEEKYSTEQKYIAKFDKFRNELIDLQHKLSKKEKRQLYEESLKTGDVIGLHILNNYIDLEFGLIGLK